MRPIAHRLPAAACLALLLTACGGGGGGGGGGSEAPAPPEPPPPDPPAPSYSISGVITASESQAVDSDTNDPAREAVSNDTPLLAQPIANPITLGGYINQPGSGEPGRSFNGGDVDDYYLVDLLAGQSVTMLVANFQLGDADLYLFDEGGQIVDFSIDTGELESVTAPEDGTYLVNVFAFFGATNYTLAVGSGATPLATASAQTDLVPWEAIVKYRDDDEARGGVDLDRGMGLTQRAGESGRARLMALHASGTTLRQRLRRLGPALGKRGRIAAPALRERWETLLAVKRLQRDPDVEYAAPNYRLSAMAEPNDEAYPLQWHYPLIGLPQAWDYTTGNPGVVVAVVDTGVLPDHPDLSGQFVPGYDFVRDSADAGDGDGIDADPTDPGSSFGGGAGSFHGTHVSGTVAAAGDNGIGVAGVAYNARVMPLRALGVSGGGTTYDVSQAVRFAAGLPNDSGTTPAQPAAIINLSLGGGLPSQAEEALYAQVRDAGILVVAAAGNQASAQPSYPAAYDGVISVSAVDTQRELAPYSNTGSSVDVAAPGGNNSVDQTGDGYPDGVLSTGASVDSGSLGFVYAFLNGTSMAAPHVAGVLALMKSVNPDLSPADIDAMLAAGRLSDDLGAPGRDDQFGHGLINAQLAVLAALESIGSSPADNPRLVASASSLNFGATTTTLGLELANGGQGELSLQAIDVSEPWLQVQPADVDDNGLGEYSVSVDRDGLAAGTYAADINAQSAINSLTVRVFVSVAGAGAVSDVGTVYVLLIDPAMDETVAQFVSAGSEGRYSFRFDGVAPGDYQVIAGTDADNDLFICDGGEACGAWLTTDQPILFNLEADREGLNFPVEYQVSLPTVSGAAQQGAAAARLEAGAK
ncbi:MAG: serine protease [Halioglobus sp.]|nr:serine protease [Halioglobus sp.]|tara:strand:- start:2821 stop:5427 length:2607 start_codon:yes stop_codon:yes gene_type:complete